MTATDHASDTHHQPHAAKDCPLSLAALSAMAGNAQASSRLYQGLSGHLPKMVKIESRRLGLWFGTDEKDDLVQQILIQFWHKDLNRYDASKGDVLRFLRTRVRWMVVDHARKLRRDTRHHESLEERQDCGVPDPVGDVRPDTLVDRAYCELHLLEFSRAVQHVLPSLEAKERLTIQRHDLDGESLRAVADALGVHPSNATRIRQRGLDKLRRALPKLMTKPNTQRPAPSLGTPMAMAA